MIGTATVIRGDALHLPLPDASVDLICTSPPYFALRSYQDSGAHYTGQLGSEPTPAEFLEALLAATREMVRVLKPSGSLFVNLGDKYAGSDGTSGGPGSKLGGGAANGRARGTKTTSKKGTGNRAPGAPTKSLIGIPWRYAINCIDQLGLILRAEIIWAKPNGLPESVTDRVRRSHEQWFHFTKMPRYFAAVDEIREPQDNFVSGTKGPSRKSAPQSFEQAGFAHKQGGFNDYRSTNGIAYNPLGKLPGSVWTIPTQPLEVPPELGVDHFAAYPMEWPRRIIQGWTPTGICVVCGEGRRPTTDKTPMLWRESPTIAGRTNGARKPASGTMLAAAETTITGYSCGCPTPTAPTRPAICLDPFGGTGTTALVAKALGRHGITIDLSADYCRLAEWRCNNPQQLAAALQVEKPDVIPAGQLSLFEEPR